MMRNRRHRVPFFRRNARIIFAILLLLVLMVLLLIPFASNSQTKPVTVSGYPAKFIYNGDTVAVLAIRQLRQINLVFNQRNSLRDQNASLAREIALLTKINSEKDTVFLSKDQQIKLITQQVGVREAEVKALDISYKWQLAEDKKVISKLKWQKYGLVTLLVGAVGFVVFH